MLLLPPNWSSYSSNRLFQIANYPEFCAILYNSHFFKITDFFKDELQGQTACNQNVFIKLNASVSYYALTKEGVCFTKQLEKRKEKGLSETEFFGVRRFLIFYWHGFKQKTRGRILKTGHATGLSMPGLWASSIFLAVVLSELVFSLENA